MHSIHFLPYDFFSPVFSLSYVRSFEIHLTSLFDKFLIENIFFYFWFAFKQNHMHLGFPIASYLPGMNFKHLMQYRFPQYSHSSILSFSLLKIFSQSSHFQAFLPSLPNLEFLLPLCVPLFFSFAIGALEIATFSPVFCWSFSLISVIPEKIKFIYVIELPYTCYCTESTCRGFQGVVTSVTYVVYIVHLTGRMKFLAGNLNGSIYSFRLDSHRISSEFISKHHTMVISMLLE